jgi:hypothetical protein
MKAVPKKRATLKVKAVPTRKTDAEYQANWRNRQRKLGLVPMGSIWVHGDDVEKIRKYIMRTKSARGL